MATNKEVNTRAAPVYKKFLTKIRSLKVLLFGMRGLGVEIAKNLLLSEIAQLGLYDANIANVKDMGANFYLKEEQCGKMSRVEAVKDKLQELNSRCVIKDESQSNIFTIAPTYNVIIVSEFVISPKMIYELNKVARNNKIGFIYCFVFGLIGSIFVDFGKEFTIQDPNSKDPISVPIQMISNEQQTIVYTSENHGLGDGQDVKFYEVQGMTEINGLIGKTKVQTGKSLQVSIDSTKFGQYMTGGILTQIKAPKVVNFQPLKLALDNPYENTSCLFDIEQRKCGQVNQLHLAIYSLLQFYEQKDRLPALHSFDDAITLQAIALKINESYQPYCKHKVKQVSEQIMMNTALYAEAQITSQTSFFAGIAAQEALKFVGQFTPLQQFLHYDCFESLASNIPSNMPMNRYHDYYAVYGDVVDKWMKMNVFMVGAGALGCELLKGFALMGVSTKGKLTVTDMDSIEESNLSRQFLFHPKNVGKLKSISAIEEVKQMNSSANYIAKWSKVDETTQNEFTNEFWQELNAVVAAVDNIEARKYIDTQCSIHQKPFLESGTMGTVCNTDVVIPNVTISYNDIKTQKTQDTPMCTIKHFPYLIEHCIEWGRSFFEKEFSMIPLDLVAFIKNEGDYKKEMYSEKIAFITVTKLRWLKSLLEIKQKGIAEAVAVTHSLFYEHFNHSIVTLLKLHPGNEFWTGSKRRPDITELDIANTLHYNFFKYTVLLLLQIVQIKYESEEEVEKEIKSTMLKLKPIPYAINQSAQQIVQSEIESKDGKALSCNSNCNSKWSPEEKQEVEQLFEEIAKLSKGMKESDVIPQVFEKDVDSNHHIDFIHYVSQLRALNYKISNCERAQTHLVAGKIIPAIITTTATIIGSVINEFCKVAQGVNKLELLKNMNCDLSVASFMITEPPEVRRIKSVKLDEALQAPTKAIPEGFTIYDKIILKAPLKIKDLTANFNQYLKEKYQNDTPVKINYITAEKVTIYNKYACKTVPEETVEEKYITVTKKSIDPSIYYLNLTFIMEFESDINKVPVTPRIYYQLK